MLVKAVQGRAAYETEVDPTTKQIADVVGTLRAAISKGNSLDSDITKIPISLEGLAIRMITRRLKDYLDENLTELESKQADEDAAYFRRIIDEQLPFETPDDPAGSAEMQQTSGLVQTTGDRFERNSYTREAMNGL